MTRRLLQEIDLDTGFTIRETYKLNGRRHRDPTEGPAVIKRDPATGVVTYEEYVQHGRSHRLDGPAKIERDPKTHVVIAEWYGQLGLSHREDGPSLIERDAVTGEVTLESFAQRGRKHRAIGPSQIEWDPATRVVVLELYEQQGRWHREPTEGPARIERNPKSGTETRRQFWKNGVLVSDPRRPGRPRRGRTSDRTP